MMTIDPYEHVDGVRFGGSSSALFTRLGVPLSRCTTRRGEEEFRYPQSRWRFSDDRLVECTFALRSPVRVREQEVGSFRAWLPTVDPGATTSCGFLVSQVFGIAVDLDDERTEYVSVFERGRWDDPA